VQVVAQKEAHAFDTYVRQKEVKQIAVSNRTNGQWDLRPLIEGEFFSGLESCVVEAQSTMNYEVRKDADSGESLLFGLNGRRHKRPG